MSGAQRTVLARAEAVGKSYGEGALATQVLEAVSLTVYGGELALIMGPSGSGKTTLVSILAGLRKPSRGAVELGGRVLTGMTEAQVAAVRRTQLGFVFQSCNLFPALSAEDNVAEVLTLRGNSLTEARRAARELLERVGLGERMHHKPAQLSGGQKQRVALARALAGRPPLIIADEPTAALDRTTTEAVMELLRGHVARDTAVLLVTHDHRLERWAHRVVEMEDGAMVRERTLVAPQDTQGKDA